MKKKQLTSRFASAPSSGLGYERIQHHSRNTYRDSSTVVIIPTRGQAHARTLSVWFVQSIMSLIAPMNKKRAVLFACGDEVGQAYDSLVRGILDNPELSKWKYVLTLEDDMIIPPDAHIRLIESIEDCGLDAVGGMYFTKGDTNMPMAYGDPRKTELEFQPRDVREALEAGSVMEVNGIAMGCSLYRMSLFREIEPPWFQTFADVVDGGAQAWTQDLYFCRKARAKGKRFGVDMRVKCGHFDDLGTVY
jgi:hypothetical protein